MTETVRPFEAGILDFNLRRMTDAEASSFGIPLELAGHLGDWRQYPPNIARHFPNGVSWYRAEQPWFFADVLANNEQADRLKASDILILSGSGLSAHALERGKSPSEYTEALTRSQEVVRDFLGEGKWVMGICFGGQLALNAVGGHIGRLPEGVTEAGWLSHIRTPEGADDEVFIDVPEVFGAPHFHNDYVESLPDVGTRVRTASGVITVTRSEVLAVRRGYRDRDGLRDTGREYIMASVIEFDNGARLYQIQPHPEMATPEKATFLVRMNEWLGKETEMGQDYYQQAQRIPGGADFSVSTVIPRFVEAARQHMEETQQIHYIETVMLQDLFRYLLK